MNTFNLQKIIDQYGLNANDLAPELFPENKYPMIAITRVLKGEAQLNADQVSKLSAITSIPVEHLYSGAKYDMTSPSEGIIRIEADDYKAELDQTTWITKIYHKGKLFHDSVIHNGAQPLSQYLHTLDTLILNHKQNVKN